MTGTIFKIMVLLAVVMVTTGCYNSEKDYEIIVEEKENLAKELDTARQEKVILTKALGNIQNEQESLQTLLNVSHNLMPGVRQQGGTTSLPPLRVLGSTAAGAGAGEDDYWVQAPAVQAPAAVVPPTAPRASTSDGPASGSTGKIYITQPGDVLSTIAMKHNTTVDRLLELNPGLRTRRDYMIWADDKIKVP